MKWNCVVHIASAVAMIAAVGCSRAPEDRLLPDSFAGESATGSQGRLRTQEPFPLQVIADRPIDLALLTREQARNRLIVSGDAYPKGSQDLPWLAQPSEAVADGEFNPAATPFWATKSPAWVDVNLARLCYVTQVVVEPYSHTLGVGSFSVSLITGDGTELPVATNVTSTAPDGANAPALPSAIVATFPPHVAQRVKLHITAPNDSPDPMMYVRRIRVLGVPADGPFIAQPAEIAEPMLKAFDANRHDLAVFAEDAAAAQVRATGALRPGSEIIPFLESPVPSEFWGAKAPAAVTIDLGRVCYVNQVGVWPLSASHGVGRFYVKAITENGEEVDTTPAADVTAAAPDDESSGMRPQPLSVAFEPVAVQRLRLYFPARRDGDSAYVNRIQVMGVPTLE